MAFWDIVAFLTCITIFLMPTMLVAWEVGWGHRKRHSRRFRFKLRTVFYWITGICLFLTVVQSEMFLFVAGLAIAAFTAGILVRFVVESIFPKRILARRYLHKQNTAHAGVEVGEWLAQLSVEGKGDETTHATDRPTNKNGTGKWWLKKSPTMRLGRYGIWN